MEADDRVIAAIAFAIVGLVFRAAPILQPDASRMAALPMAAFAPLAYFAARSVLPQRWSLGVAGLGAFGTQVLSATSRALGLDTWGVLLVGGAVALLVRARARGSEAWVAVAWLEGLACMVRPANGPAMVFTALYALAVQPRTAWRFFAAAAAWWAVALAWLWRRGYRLSPHALALDPRRLHVSWAGLVGDVISPSRGLVVYVPLLLAAVLVLVTRIRGARSLLLAALGGCVILAQLVVLSSSVPWWGGHVYGAASTASLVPWIVLLAILAAEALRASAPAPGLFVRSFVVPLAALLCAASVVVNAVGAFSFDASRWNAVPNDVDVDPARLWVWSDAQVLAPFVKPPAAFYPLPAEGLMLGDASADRYLAGAWWDAQDGYRWTRGGGASVVRFAVMTPARAAILELTLRPYLPAGQRTAQPLTVSLNDRPVGSLDVRHPAFFTYRFVVPGDMIEPESTLRISTPGAVSPRDANDGADERTLGVAVQSLRWRSAS